MIGVLLWLFLNRTRVGMMIRAGVDDRGMLSASGVNVNLVFAITFAIGAGLAGFGGVIGAVELSMVPGEDTRLLLASLVVVIVGGMGSVVGAAIGAGDPRPRRDLRSRVRADVQRRVHVPDPRAGAGVPAAGNSGQAGMRATSGMSAAHWRKAMNSGAGRLAMSARPAPSRVGCCAPRRRVGRDHERATTIAMRPRPRGCASSGGICRRATLPCSRSPSCIRSSRRRSSRSRSRRNRWRSASIALSLAFLAGYGGMISLAQMTVAGIAGYLVAIFGTSGTETISLGLAVVGRRAAGDRDRDAVRHADRLALGAHRRASTRS